MRLAHSPIAGDRHSAPSILDYGVVRQAGCASIETYPDGVSIRAIMPRTRYWFRTALLAAIAVVLIAVAIPSGDDWKWAGVHFHRFGTLARIVAGLVGTAVAIAIVLGFLRPRIAATLTARGGRFAYSEPKIRGIAHFECPLREIEAIEHEPWNGDSGGTLYIKVSRSARCRLFWDLDAEEIDAIAAAILPVWKAAIAAGAA
jgi:hypothetical protein